MSTSPGVPRSSADLAMMDAAALVARYRSGEVTPVQATQAALERIENLDHRVRALVLVDAEGAMAAARSSAQRWEAGNPLGPADGVPITIKDILMMRGHPTRRGSALTAVEPPATTDSPATARLREAGAVLLGKNTTPEFGWKGVTDSPAYPPTTNPWDPRLTAGGSSGGSAAAVSLGMGAWSIGTDAGGSVRIPGAFTGTVALKATFGRIPHYPPSPFGTLAHAGPITRSVVDAATALDVLARPDHRDWFALEAPSSSFTDRLHDGVAGLRIAYSPDLGYGVNEADVQAAVERALDVLTEAGAQVEQVGAVFDDPIEAFYTLWFTGAAKVVADHVRGPGDADLVDPELLAGIEEYGRVDAAAYLDAMQARMELGTTMGAFHTNYDLLVTPTMPMGAFEAGVDVPPGWDYRYWPSWTPYTYPFNLTGQPALSVPCGFTGKGRPIGLQIVGARHADALVLRAGQAFAECTDWHTLVPPLVQGTEPAIVEED